MQITLIKHEFLTLRKDEPSIVFTRKSQRTSQHGTKNTKTCNLTNIKTRIHMGKAKV